MMAKKKKGITVREIVTSEEVVEILEKIGRGEIIPIVRGRTWNERYAGDVEFLCDGWLLTIFNDCDSFDYVDSVVAPDGRIGKCDDWVISLEYDSFDLNNPSDLMDAALYELAYKAFKTARLDTCASPASSTSGA